MSAFRDYQELTRTIRHDAYIQNPSFPSLVRTAKSARRIQAQMRGVTYDDSGDDSNEDLSLPDPPGMFHPPLPGLATPAAESTPQELVKLDPAEIGMNVGYKNLYSGKEDKRGRFQWQTTIPEDLGKPAEDAESERWAIVVRRVKAFGDANSNKVLDVHSIIIQSPYLKELLKEVLHGYPGVTVGLKRLEFKAPFHSFVHRWSQLNTAIDKLKEQQDSETPSDESANEKMAVRVKHAQLLLDLLTMELKDVIEESTDLMKQGDISYTHLWTLFVPGTIIYSKYEGQDRAFRLVCARYGEDHKQRPCCWLICNTVDYDGSNWGIKKLDLKIYKFEGTKHIKDLPIYPLDCHADKEKIMAGLIERGTKFQDLAGTHYKAYNGIGWFINVNGQKEMRSVKGRIVVDARGWNHFNPNDYVHVTPFNLKETRHAPMMIIGRNGIPSMTHSYCPEPFFDASQEMGGDEPMPMDGSFGDKNEETKHVTLTDEQKMLCTSTVRGYALKEKIWLYFFTNSVNEIVFNEGAFESLVLPSNQKELILGFTSTQYGYRNQFDDVIEGKGRGIILLLCGPPGVGKTLTAESVAEQMKAPLFMMAGGDLGGDSTHVEIRLQSVLDMCARWNAVLLLDEADVFLEARSRHELERNKLVSIFLRLLEYYEGIMFLTTNRVETFDPAFHSRIHISLKYPDLDSKSRKTIWQNFLKSHDAAQAINREQGLQKNINTSQTNGVSVPTISINGTPTEQPSAEASAAYQAAVEEAEAKEVEQAEAELQHFKRTLPHKITPRDLNKLAQLEVNGRQIKNILKTAQLLASQRGQGLSYEHIEAVMEVTQHLHHATMDGEKARASIFS
ncbi:Hypothetical protein R9X50_00411500 [Acrodontium crateriforme]|uniref:AAA+ ATPase domain-containing protein n=1 Tax=Acrodontium crateriforme TaxID=150365 RepID=A0AAQ3MAF5_9PEZI|nr:Hypothetical protein R9X50_00411500 [Acrodontium crateriforme]